jgi:ribonuclease HI
MRVMVYIDGGSRGNPGPAAAGVVITADGEVIHQAGIYLGRATSNVAEYRGLLAGLEAARRLGASEAEVRSDSQLLVRQMTGEYRVRNPGIKPLHEKAARLAGMFRRCDFRHVPRQENLQADELVNRALDLKRNVSG